MRQRMRLIVQWVVVLVGLNVLMWQLPALVGEADRVGASLAEVSWGWVGMAVLFGSGALVLYGELHRRLLVAGGARVPGRSVQAINFAENALSTTLPAVGNAAGFVYAAHHLRKRQVDVGLAVWSLVLAGAVATVALIALGLLAVGVAGQIPVLVAVPLATGVVLGAWGCWRVASRPQVLRRCASGLIGLGRHLPASCRVRAADPEALAQRVSDRIGLLRPSVIQWMLITGCAGLSWVLDFLSLFASVTAVGHLVPWSALVVGFLVVQASIALQIFPGGVGLAEGGLLGVLVAYGVPVAPAVAGVLVYRLINWLGLAAMGWVVYAVQIHLTSHHQHRRAPECPGCGPATTR